MPSSVSLLCSFQLLQGHNSKISPKIPAYLGYGTIIIVLYGEEKFKTLCRGKFFDGIIPPNIML